ncbi:hypothetical protein AWM75_04380 [Aerococcus urinaehominis]|uniref:Uncharacterized protein n=1 Tax=Aerococcus urinaehominis TaxID=128944 RepID=A0A0X8FL33_9LACT|nr:hypothetical protein [Aerococcus urinaehominis]AMB99284.1 hypothetical protein AWM75_04380 [Aerococcus urinaehominis]SDM18902.1 hypothetical protein SAMN04487985_1083 [Aerococcus urinaehominis]
MKKGLIEDLKVIIATFIFGLAWLLITSYISGSQPLLVAEDYKFLFTYTFIVSVVFIGSRLIKGQKTNKSN